jgi:hypothetical protein
MSGWIGSWGVSATVADLTVTNSQVIAVNTSTNALRITQTGTGNALVVEDSANPDSNPFVINASGAVSTGTSLSVGTSIQNWIHTVYETGNSFTQYINSVSGTTSTDGVLIGLSGSDAIIRNRESGNVLLYTADTIQFTVTSTGNLHGTSGTTAMTNGFFYIPSAAGAPSGVPTAIAGRVPMYYDTTNNNFYIYNGAWKKILLA